VDVSDDLGAYRASARGQSAAGKQFGCGCLGAVVTLALLGVFGSAVASGHTSEALLALVPPGALGWLFWYRTSRSKR
jgi:hypothetical protein